MANIFSNRPKTQSNFNKYVNNAANMTTLDSWMADEGKPLSVNDHKQGVFYRTQ